MTARDFQPYIDRANEMLDAMPPMSDAEICGVCGREIGSDDYGLDVPVCSEACWLTWMEAEDAL